MTSSMKGGSPQRHDSPRRGRAMTRVGRFAQRRTDSAGISCSVERSIEVLGTCSAFLLLREAFYGTRRFNDLVAGTGLSESVAAKRLRQLVENGVMEQRAYRDPGARTRFEYLLSETGLLLFPLMVSLMRWGDELGAGDIELIHAECGRPVDTIVQCTMGHEVTLEHTQVRLLRDANPGEHGA